jgi:hypothetical protein
MIFHACLHRLRQYGLPTSKEPRLNPCPTSQTSQTPFVPILSSPNPHPAQLPHPALQHPTPYPPSRHRPCRCGVMALATLLAGEPQLTLEVWHKERCVLAPACINRSRP